MQPAVAPQIEELSQHPDLASLLARWHVGEFGHLYPGWDVHTAVGELLAEPTWIAFEDGGRSAHDVLGSISLIADDELDGFRDAGPWLASLYVVPAARKRGVGRLLVRLVESAARDRGVDRMHLFTEDRAEWYESMGWRPLTRTTKHGYAVSVMVKETDPDAPRRVVVSGWCTNPDIATAYSYLRPGGTPDDRARLREEIAPSLWIAGEATSVEYPGTMHGAWFEGERAARAVIASRASGRTAVVVGAGLAGLAAARTLREANWNVIVLEASSTLGGRAATDRSLGGPVHTGAAWFHGDRANPVAEWAARTGTTTEPSTWHRAATTLAGRGPLPHAELVRLRDIRDRIEDALDDAAMTADETAALGPVLRALLADVSTPDAVVVRAWLFSEFENLYAAPVDDLSLVHRAEPFAMSGRDVFISGPLDSVIGAIASGLDVRTDHRVTSITRVDAGWSVATPSGTFVADAVVVTIPVGALKTGRVRFDPKLPAPIHAAFDRIGAGRVAKVIARFDRAWWAPIPAFFLAADPPSPLPVWVDVSALAGFAALCGFATGEHAIALEAMSENELCAHAAGVLATARLPVMRGIATTTPRAT